MGFFLQRDRERNITVTTTRSIPVPTTCQVLSLRSRPTPRSYKKYLRALTIKKKMDQAEAAVSRHESRYTVVKIRRETLPW